MKKIACIMLLVLALVAVVVGPARTSAANGDVTVTGAARATFAQGATFGAVALKSLEVGTGVFIDPDGTANGVYSAVLTGRSLLGQSQQITIDGKVLSGDVAPDGRVHFNGIATIIANAELIDDHGVQIAPLHYPHLSHTEIFQSLETFYRRFYFRRQKIASLVAEMVKSPQMMRRRLREGVEFFQFLRQREMVG